MTAKSQLNSVANCDAVKMQTWTLYFWKLIFFFFFSITSISIYLVKYLENDGWRQRIWLDP